MEAAFVMPMVLCVFVMLIYTSFYLYDRCVFKQDAFILCFRESIRKEEGAPRVDPSYMQQGEARQFENKYFAVNDLETSAKAMGKKAVFQGSARVLPTSFGSYFLMPKSIWRLTFYGSARKTDPPWSIRSYRRKTYVVKKGLKALEKNLYGTSHVFRRNDKLSRSPMPAGCSEWVSIPHACGKSHQRASALQLSNHRWRAFSVLRHNVETKCCQNV